MARIRIISANEAHHVPVTNCSVSADIPVDGQFHDIHPDLLPVLDSSSVEYEVEPKTPKRPAGARKAGRARKAGGPAARPSKAKAKAKAKGK